MALSLSSVVKTRRVRPPYICLYGEHGIGKTTIGADAPGAVFIATEDGQGNVDADAFPLCTSSDDVMAAIASLQNEEHGFQTVVLDSVDWLEDLIHKEIAQAEKKESIGDIGYGVGYTRAADKIRQVLLALADLRESRGMAIILLAHAETKRVEDPLKPSYDRVQIKLHRKAAALVREACENIGLCALDTAVIESEEFGKKKGKAMLNAPRVIYWRKSDAYDSKNRLGLPGKTALSWKVFADEFSKAQATKEGEK